jgi:hypothetical protein
MRRILRLFIVITSLFILPNCASDADDIRRHATLSIIFPSTPQRDLLTDTKYSNLLIEITYVSSWTASPNLEDLAYLRTKLLNYCHKDNISIVVNTPIDVTRVPTLMWNDGTLAIFETQHAMYASVGDTLVVRILYLPGFYAPDMVVRGLAYGERSFVIFTNQCGSKHERAVLLHEFGHLLGLVGCGTRCQSEHEEKDPKHTPHCKNEGKCVMYWCSPEVQDPDFDEPCKEDLKANGGK